MTCFRRVPVDALRIEPWANGGGSTTVLDCGPSTQDWSWRLSIAQIDADGPFSRLEDTKRQFVALDGPVALRFGDQSTTALHRLQVTAFAGDDAPHAQLIDGPTRAFNLMLRHGVSGALIARPLNGAMVMPNLGQARWFVLLLAGSATLTCANEHAVLEPGQPIWIDSADGAAWRMEGGGEVVLVRLDVQTSHP